MVPLAASEDLAVSPAPRITPGAWATLSAIGLMALVQLRFVSWEWLLNPQYTFGWGVPFLAVYLFWKRWPGRPAPLPAPALGLLAAAIVLALLLLPLRVMLEANPDWRFLLWADLAVLECGLLLAVAYVGGWPWLRHFIIPVLFVLLAAPWPTRAEKSLIQSFTHHISAATVEAMNWMGIPALLRGNVIELRKATLGVNEACSGIRSFQGTLMVSVFFGELYQLKWLRRLALVGLALGGTILLKFVRTTILAWLAATYGAAKESAWHDTVGLSVLVASIGLALGFALLLARTPKPTAPKPENETPQAPTTSPRWFSWGLAGGIVLWLGTTEAVNAWWFHGREPAGAPRASWTVEWPKHEAGLSVAPMSDEILTILRCDVGQTATWARADGSEWTVFFIRWGAGRIAAQLARSHTPDVCMAANGFKMVSELGSSTLSVHGLQLPFETYVFEANGKKWFVFFCLFEDRVAAHEPLTEARDKYLLQLEAHNRIKAALEGKRFYGQQVLEVAMNGYPSLEAARSALERSLPDLVKTQSK